MRPLIGNRIYGCDDCQLICPWNKYAQVSGLPDFNVRAALDSPHLLVLWSWTKEEFLRYTEGSAIRRIGFDRWQRNLAVALGNALRRDPPIAPEQRTAIQQALRAHRGQVGAMVQEHVDWALA
jgi:epoxyqueuosine reductase